MAHYLDPKNDFVFKRIFGSHPDLLISFLNALMPFEPGRVIESIEYVSNELVPDNPAKKFSIVDVRCRDNYGRQFIVEMQMEWSNVFPSRMLFNASKTYVQQLRRKEDYIRLHPVYALGILNEAYDRVTPEFYHRYQFVNRENTDEVIEGMELILVELPKVTAETWSDRRTAVLWLRFLKETEDGATSVPDDLLAHEAIREAADICEEGAFTPEELALYENYWDSIRTEMSVIRASLVEGLIEGEKKGLEKGLEKGRREGLEKGREEGAHKKTVQIVLNCAHRGMLKEDIADMVNLSVDEISAILKNRPENT
ncbi:MAG: Rpn family recombination-promoting nuclease/putative transposase [Tannerella sp.]|jgi:predicted transposase/invertase (TIGR01784 family)|nr:Rpn family recombination-promoting nuclease/putative transposase [Tannerella sp.]